MLWTVVVEKEIATRVVILGGCVSPLNLEGERPVWLLDSVFSRWKNATHLQ